MAYIKFEINDALITKEHQSIKAFKSFYFPRSTFRSLFDFSLLSHFSIETQASLAKKLRQTYTFDTQTLHSENLATLPCP